MVSILFLHGGSLNRAMWAPQIEALKNQFDVHALDLPGHGQNIDHVFTLEAALVAVDNYIESKIKGPTIVAGLSLGGYVAIAYADRHPEKISRLIISGCCVQYVGFMGYLAKINTVLMKAISETYFESMQKKALLKITSHSVAENICDNAISLHGARDSMSEVIGINFVAMIKRCNVPVLLVNGENDTLNRKYEAGYLEAGNKLILETMKNCGHLCSLENPELFTGILREFASQP